MTQSKTKLQKLNRMQLEHVKYLNGMIEARQARVSNLAFRKRVLEQQKVHNYQSEYSRLRAHLDETSMPPTTKKLMDERIKHLESLGIKAVGGIN